MKTLIRTIFILGILAGTGWAATQVHARFQSLWVDLYLVFCIGLPLLVSLPNLVNGMQGLIGLFQSLFSITAGLLTLTLVHQYLTPNWALASLAGAVLPALVTGIQGWRLTQARMNLQRAFIELEHSNLAEALELARTAHLFFIQRGMSDGEAEANLVIGVVAYRRNDTASAARYLSSTYQYYRRHNLTQRIKQVSELLEDLKRRGVPVDSGSSAGMEEEETKGLDGQFVLNVVLSVGCLLALSYFWKIEPLKASIPVLVWLGVALAGWIIANYAAAALCSSSKPRRSVVGPLLLVNVGWLALAVGTLPLLAERATAAAKSMTISSASE